MKKRLLCLTMVFAMLIGVLAGCGSQSSASEAAASAQSDSTVQAETAPEETPAPPAEEPATPAEESESASEATEEEPVTAGTNENIVSVTDEPLTLTCWTATLRSLETLTETLNDLEFIQVMEEKTGVHIEWTQASSMGASEVFQLMVAGGDYTDMVFDLTSMYTGGVTKALEDAVVVDLTDMVEEYAPNYYYIMNYDEDLRRDAVTDDGQHLAVYSCYDFESDGYKPLSGPMIRTDWLEELNLEIPVTYDDYYEVGLAFKNKYQCSDPILMMGDGMFASGYFTGGYGTYGFGSSGTGAATVGLYRDGDTVKSSLIEDGFVDYLTMMNQWYADGVIGADFFSHPTTNMGDDYNGYVYNDQTGIFLGDAVNMSSFAEMSVSSDNFALAGAPDPVQKEGDVSQFGYNRSKRQGHDGTVTTACETPEIALAWIDQWFCQEGFMLGNYGIEDKTYSYNEEGLPVYTELITNNPDGLPQMMATVFYTNAFAPGLYTQSTRFNMWTDDILDAVDTWATSTTGEGIIPTVSLTVEESETYAELASDIQTYASQYIVKYITGEIPMENYASFKETLIGMGIQECIDVYQAALSRYMTR